MTAYQIGGACVVLFALACLIPTAVQRIRRRGTERDAAEAGRIEDIRRHEHWDSVREAKLGRAKSDLAHVTGQRDMLNDLWHQALRRNQALLEHIGDEREAAAVQALADSPAYFSAMAAREAASIDADWFDLSSDER